MNAISTQPRQARRPSSFRRRMMLTIVGLVGAFALLVSLATLLIGLWGARLGAYEWLASDHMQSFEAYNDMLLDHLEHDAEMVLGNPATADAVRAQRWDDDVLGSGPISEQIQWLAVADDGRVVSSLDACDGLDIAGLLRSHGRLSLHCGAIPLLAAAATHVDVGRPFFVARRIDRAGYVDGLRLLAKTEVALLGPSGFVAATTKSRTGDPLPIELSDRQLDRIRDSETHWYGTLKLRLPDYSGYVMGSGERIASAGEDVVDMFVYAGRFTLSDGSGMHVVYAVPTLVMELPAIYSSMGVAASSLLLLLVLTLVGWRLAVRFTRPLGALAAAADRVGRGDLTTKVPAEGSAELVTLGQSFNEMTGRLSESRALEQARTEELVERSAQLEEAYRQVKEAHDELKETQARLVDASRQAGMADLAASVLHNVGNVLNSVNVSASVAGEGLRQLRTDQLAAALGLLERPAGTLGDYLECDPKGQRVLPYLKTLSEHMKTERERVLAELARLRDHLDHVKNVVAMHQAYAKPGGLEEPCQIPALVGDALRLAVTSSAAGVTIKRELEPGPDVIVDRHKVLQILVNLVRNATQAVDGEGTVTIRSWRRGDEIVVEVADDGVGITRDHMARIFNHGFTTKAKGNGFGLHASALAAQDLGGSLQCESPGPGQGATFRLVIPTEGRAARCA